MQLIMLKSICSATHPRQGSFLVAVHVKEVFFGVGEGEGERDLNGGKLEKEKRSMGSRMTCMRLTMRERDGKKRADPTAHNA